jgi:hypothetical protein
MDTSNRSKRPKPRDFVQYDPNNYYAKLGISPLTPIKEIKAIIIRKQMEIKNQLHRSSQQKSKKTKYIKEFDKWQKIGESFASPKKREEYDRLNPQSELLTVQLSDYDDWFERSSRLDLVSAWLVKELGQEKFLPTPGSLQLWCPMGLDPELLDFLAQFEIQDEILSPEVAHLGNMDDFADLVNSQKVSMEQPLPVNELEFIAGKRHDQEVEVDQTGAPNEQMNIKNENDKLIDNNKLKQGE